MTALTKVYNKLDYNRSSYLAAHQLVGQFDCGDVLLHKKKVALSHIAECVTTIDRALNNPQNQMFMEFITNLREESNKFHWEFKRVHNETVAHNDVICYSFYDPKSEISVSINGRVLFNEFSGFSGLIERKRGTMMPLTSNEIDELLELFDSILKIRR